jgi:hypothetical protein
LIGQAGENSPHFAARVTTTGPLLTPHVIQRLPDAFVPPHPQPVEPIGWPDASFKIGPA